MSKQYYIRSRGIVRGPFSPEKLKELARRGKFSRAYHVSLDGVNWEPAANHPELLPEAKTVKVRKQTSDPEAKEDGYQLTPDGQPGADGNTPEKPKAGDWQEQTSWYYVDGGNQAGPVSFAQLRQLASQGRLQRDQLVWSEGLPDWTTAEDVPRLFASDDYVIQCPHCNKHLKVSENAFGKTMPCPLCTKPIVIPSASSSFGTPGKQSPLPLVAEQTSKWRQQGEGSNSKMIAVVAGIAVGLLLVVMIAGWFIYFDVQGDSPDPSFAAGAAGPRELTEEEACAAAVASCGGCGGCVGIAIFLMVVIIALNIALLVWVARDAKSRGMDSAVLWMVLVMFTSLLGLLIYLFARPQGNVVLCARCGNKRLQASALCPHCGNP